MLDFAMNLSFICITMPIYAISLWAVWTKTTTFLSLISLLALFINIIALGLYSTLWLVCM